MKIQKLVSYEVRFEVTRVLTVSPLYCIVCRHVYRSNNGMKSVSVCIQWWKFLFAYSVDPKMIHGITIQALTQIRYLVIESISFHLRGGDL